MANFQQFLTKLKILASFCPGYFTSHPYASSKFITCEYNDHKIVNFEQAGFIEGEKKGRVIHSEDDVRELFGDGNYSFSYLRNFIINIDENVFNSSGNDYEHVYEVLDRYIEYCYSLSLRGRENDGH